MRVRRNGRVGAREAGASRRTAQYGAPVHACLRQDMSSSNKKLQIKFCKSLTVSPHSAGVRHEPCRCRPLATRCSYSRPEMGFCIRTKELHSWCGDFAQHGALCCASSYFPKFAIIK